MMDAYPMPQIDEVIDKLEMKDCVILGHIVRSGNVKPDPGKLEAVKQFPDPQSKKQTKAFLGDLSIFGISLIWSYKEYYPYI